MNRQNLLIGALTVVLIGAAYFYLFGGSTPELPLTTNTAPGAAEQQFIDLTSKLAGISFDTTVIDDPRLASLTDFTVPVNPESQGRVDPFAPVGR